MNNEFLTRMQNLLKDDYEEVKMLAEGTVNNGSEVLEVK